MMYTRIGSAYNSYSRFASENKESQTIADVIQKKVNDKNTAAAAAKGNEQADTVSISQAAREALLAAKMSNLAAWSQQG